MPDNLRSGVRRAHRYEPDLNPTYSDLARHYGVAVLPARVRRPRDKAKAEVAVQVVERWILAALRHRTFFSLAELNMAVTALLERLNTRPFRKLEGSRRAQFERLDRPALRPLPASPYVFAEWKTVRVHIDYHVEVGGHYYSVPHALVRRQLDARVTARTVECFHRGQRVASHVRSARRGRHTTAPEHMPEQHRQMGEWPPERFLRQAGRIGPSTAALVAAVLKARRHPSRRSVPVSDCCAWPSVTATPAWKRPPPARWPSAATATAASNRSSNTGSTRPAPRRPNPPRRSSTTTFAARSTTSDA